MLNSVTKDKIEEIVIFIIVVFSSSNFSIDNETSFAVQIIKQSEAKNYALITAGAPQ